MNKRFILLPALFVLGLAAGAAMMDQLGDDKAVQRLADNPGTSALLAENDSHPMADAFVVSQATEVERIQRLEQEIESLTVRIQQLERAARAAQQAETTETGEETASPRNTVDTPVSRSSAALTVDNLVRAGVAEALAADIIRRKNELDLQTLELRDRAVREGYLGTGRYSRELNALLEQDVSLRDELGEDAYDRYLYETGQTNRVRIASVMLGSPAEQAGMKKGDVVLSYGDRQLFKWSELQDATTRGNRGDYVNMTVLRDGQLVNLWLPRGPLGVRLGSLRLEP